VAFFALSNHSKKKFKLLKFISDHFHVKNVRFAEGMSELTDTSATSQ
jgi:hypothetical protein